LTYTTSVKKLSIREEFFFEAWTWAFETVKFRYQLLLLVEYSFKNIGARTCNKKNGFNFN